MSGNSLQTICGGPSCDIFLNEYFKSLERDVKRNRKFEHNILQALLAHKRYDWVLECLKRKFIYNRNTIAKKWIGVSKLSARWLS